MTFNDDFAINFVLLHSIDTQCPCPSKPANGTILSNCSGYQSFGSYVYFSCDSGFHQSSGDTTRRCSPGGIWSGSDLVCEKGQLIALILMLRKINTHPNILKLNLHNNIFVCIIVIKNVISCNIHGKCIMSIVYVHTYSCRLCRQAHNYTKYYRMLFDCVPFTNNSLRIIILLYIILICYVI